MKQFFLPLKVFVFGHLVVLLLTLFLPAIGGVGDQLAAGSANIASTFWGWSWVSGSVKFLVIAIAEGIVLFLTGVTFVKSKAS